MVGSKQLSKQYRDVTSKRLFKVSIVSVLMIRLDQPERGNYGIVEQSRAVQIKTYL